MERILGELMVADAWGTTPEDIEKKLVMPVYKLALRFRRPEGKNLEDIYTLVRRTIMQDNQQVGSPDRFAVWENGWREVLREHTYFGSTDALKPKYIRRNIRARLCGEYAIVAPEFEATYYYAFLQWVFKTYCLGENTFYEFGCGTGHNLWQMAQIEPKREMIGLDYSPAALAIISRIGYDTFARVRPCYFDMSQPNDDFQIEPNATVFTCGALEQLAGGTKDFFDCILRWKPAICVHIEPCSELYGDSEFDRLGRWFQDKRGYTNNLLSTLQNLEKEGKATIIKAKRTGIGSLLIEGYNLFVWRPL